MKTEIGTGGIIRAGLSDDQLWLIDYRLCQRMTDVEGDELVVLRGLFSPDEIVEMRDQVGQAFDQPDPAGSNGQIIRHQMFLKGRMFAALIDRSPVIDFVEAILGDTCRLIPENALYTRPGQGVDSCHVDEVVHYHPPEEILEQAPERRKRLLGIHPRGLDG